MSQTENPRAFQAGEDVNWSVGRLVGWLEYSKFLKGAA